jgi:hypothetical protein
MTKIWEKMQKDIEEQLKLEKDQARKAEVSGVSDGIWKQALGAIGVAVPWHMAAAAGNTYASFTTANQMAGMGYMPGQQVAARYALGPFDSLGKNAAYQIGRSLPIVGGAIESYGHLVAAQEGQSQKTGLAQNYDQRYQGMASENFAIRSELGQRYAASQIGIPDAIRSFRVKMQGFQSRYADISAYDKRVETAIANYDYWSKVNASTDGMSVQGHRELAKQEMIGLANMSPLIQQKMKLRDQELGVAIRERAFDLTQGSFGPGTPSSGLGAGSTAYQPMGLNVGTATSDDVVNELQDMKGILASKLDEINAQLRPFIGAQK